MNVFDSFRLCGKVALITGGARDLGFDMAMALGQAGADVVVTSRTLANARQAAEKIKAACEQVDTLGLQLDHTDWEQVRAVAKEAHAWRGHLDVLVNNAGGGSGKGKCNLFERRVEDIVALIHNNLLGPMLCCKAVGPYMIAQRSGKIINIASIAALVGRDRRMYARHDKEEQPIDYAAAKAGVIGLTRDLAGLMAPHGVCVNAICPGGFDKGGDNPAGFIQDYADATMLGRMGKLGHDLKGAAVFLASPASDYVTAEALVVDGGFSVWK